MKYKTAVVIVSLALASVVLIGTARGLSGNTTQQNNQVAASFYPVYIAAMNLTEGVDVYKRQVLEEFCVWFHMAQCLQL